MTAKFDKEKYSYFILSVSHLQNKLQLQIYTALYS